MKSNGFLEGRGVIGVERGLVFEDAVDPVEELGHETMGGLPLSLRR